MTWLPAAIGVIALGLVWWIGPRWINRKKRRRP